MKQRPSPETLLKRISQEERKERFGKLKIYLGAAPGVGKTYAMLQDALTKRAQGLDVQVGIVESHGRKEIEKLLTHFEILPRQTVLYHDKTLNEFDLDAALKRNPGLILIDEMAHTNVPGLRHSKRWQDIKEILDRGIDVYTTLNVQHVESLNDVVSQIIHARVKETVPDFMLELADTIELVDLPVEDLLIRLQEGKVYIPTQAKLAADHFFRKGNLAALRELALRTTAECVNTQVLLYRQGLGIKHIWATTDKILVCVGSGPNSEQLIRSARRHASQSQAEWIAVHVETPHLQQSDEDRKNTIQNLRFAEQLGAETRILTGMDVVSEIMNFAHEENITQIILAKHLKPRWKTYFFRSLADEIIRYSHEIDVYIISQEKNKPAIKNKIAQQKDKFKWKPYLIATCIVATITVMSYFLFPYLSKENLLLIYLLGVTIVALFGRIGPTLFTIFFSILIYRSLYILLNSTISDVKLFLSLIIILLIGCTISYLSLILQRQAIFARINEHHTSILHKFSQRLASLRGIDHIVQTATHFIGVEFDSDVSFLLSTDDQLQIKISLGAVATLNEKEQAVAEWVYNIGQPAGFGTDTLSFSEALYLPLLTPHGTIGVVRICPLRNKERLLIPEEIHLLEACTNQVAQAIEVEYLQNVFNS